MDNTIAVPEAKPSSRPDVDKTLAIPAGANSGRPEVDLSVLVPVYNEAEAVGPTIDKLIQALKMFKSLRWEIICVNDGSTDATAEVLGAYRDGESVLVLSNKVNRGYGAALKRGARRASGRLIALIDADGTYDPARLASLLQAMNRGADMAVGARTGSEVHIPAIRRPAKWFLRKLAEFLSGEPIPDLNSGLRVIRAELFMRHIRLLPDGFSLTTTLTLALATGGWRVDYIAIDYAKRVGKSSIRPVRDTLKFFGIILRTVTHFNPLRVFGPLAGLLMLAGVGVGVGSKYFYGELMDVTSVTLFLGGLQILGIGVLADLIAKRL